MRAPRRAHTFDRVRSDQRRRPEMPRYIVQRTFPEGLHIPVENGGADICAAVIERNTEECVTWVHSYVSEDKRTTFCVYDAPTPEAIRKTASHNQLPVDQPELNRSSQQCLSTGMYLSRATDSG
jgi:hypothetical protein